MILQVALGTIDFRHRVTCQESLIRQKCGNRRAGSPHASVKARQTDPNQNGHKTDLVASSRADLVHRRRQCDLGFHHTCAVAAGYNRREAAREMSAFPLVEDTLALSERGRVSQSFEIRETFILAFLHMFVLRIHDRLRIRLEPARSSWSDESSVIGRCHTDKTWWATHNQPFKVARQRLM